MADSYYTKLESSVVWLFRKDGGVERAICAGAEKAEVDGDEIIVYMPGGKKKIYSIRGFFKRNG
jgi:hypothetical protein